MSSEEKRAVRDALIQKRVEGGLTREELVQMIERRPDLYGRHGHLLAGLPTSKGGGGHGPEADRLRNL